MKTTIEKLAKRVAKEGYAPVLLHPEVRRLCELVRADEREACARVCDAFQARDVGMQPAECAAAIRART